MEGYDYNKISRPHYLTLKNLFCSMEKSSVNKYTLLTVTLVFIHNIRGRSVPPPPKKKKKS